MLPRLCFAFCDSKTNAREAPEFPRSSASPPLPRCFHPPLLVRFSARQTDRQTETERDRERERFRERLSVVWCALKKRTIVYTHARKQRARGFLFVAGDTKRARKSREEIGRRAHRGGYCCVQKIRAHRERERESDLNRFDFDFPRAREREREEEGEKERERGARAVGIGNGARYPQRLRHHEHKV